MAAINIVRTWGDEAALGLRRATEAKTALTGLLDDAGKLDETQRLLQSGVHFEDPFDAARTLAEQGNRGFWDAWTKAGAAESILQRAARSAPEPAAGILRSAAADAGTAAGRLERWMYGELRGSLGSVGASAAEQLGEAVRAAALVAT